MLHMLGSKISRIPSSEYFDDIYDNIMTYMRYMASSWHIWYICDILMGDDNVMSRARMGNAQAKLTLAKLQLANRWEKTFPCFKFYILSEGDNLFLEFLKGKSSPLMIIEKYITEYFQSCEMSQIWQIYLCKNIGRLG